MHTCFIIDNSLNLQQKCVLGIPFLDYIKISIQFMMKQLGRTGFLQNRNDMLHLYVTSNPKQHLSSYQHDKLHFDYQLKSIQCRALTYPAQTLLTALQNLGKFRMITQTQTLLGYRQPTIYEPALVMFFSSRLTQRKINQFQKIIDQYQMRSEYKFIHFHLNLPLKIQKGQNNIDILRNEFENSTQYKSLIQIAYKLNKGIIKNIYHTGGRQCLQQVLISTLTNYRPTLCVDMNNIQFPNNPFPDILKSTGLPALSTNWDGEHSKVQLVRLDENKGRSKIPFPQKIKINENSFQFSITEFNVPQFYVDLSYRLSLAQSQKHLDILPFERYQLYTPKLDLLRTNLEHKTSNITNIQRVLNKANVQNAYFPLWIRHYSQYIIIGFVHCVPNKFSQILISYSNFFNFSQVLNILNNRKSYSDQKRAQQSLKQYLSSAPNYYLYSLKQYFTRLYGIQISEQYMTSANQYNLQKRMRNYLVAQKKKIEQLYKENILNHQRYVAKCCPIYNTLDAYKQFSKRKANKPQNKSHSQEVFQAYLHKIDQFHKNIGVYTYFSQHNASKNAPMTYQLNRNKLDIEQYNTYIDVNLKNQKKRKSNVAQFFDDTPFPQQQSAQIQSNNILEIQNQLLETKKQLQLGAQQINYQMQEQQEDLKIPADQKIQKSIQSSINGNPEVMQFVNNLFILKKPIKMIINPKNLQNQKYLKNKAIIQRYKRK